MKCFKKIFNHIGIAFYSGQIKVMKVVGETSLIIFYQMFYNDHGGVCFILINGNLKGVLAMFISGIHHVCSFIKKCCNHPGMAFSSGQMKGGLAIRIYCIYVYFTFIKKCLNHLLLAIKSGQMKVEVVNIFTIS